MVGGDREAAAHLGTNGHHRALIRPFAHSHGALEFRDDLSGCPTQDLEIVDLVPMQLIKADQTSSVPITDKAGFGTVETAPTPSRAGAEEVLADPLVAAHADDHIVDVGTDAFTDRRDRID